MIKLEKLPEPHVLHENKSKWTEEYKAAKATNAPDLEQLKVRYRHPEIKQQVLQETHEKCAYCESKIRHTYPGDIEHIKPKSKHEDDIFEWENLTLSCGECNRRKNDLYDEEIGIINPYDTDPSEHLYAAGALIFPKPGSSVGKLAYELFELDRAGLVERRTDQLTKVRLMLDDYASEKNITLKKLYKKRIDALREAPNEYAMATRSLIKAALSR